MQVPQRPEWFGAPVFLGDLFRLLKHRGESRIAATCRLMSHQLGWELRLEINGTLHQSQVCRSQDEVLDTSEHWKAAMVEKGWQ